MPSGAPDQCSDGLCPGPWQVKLAGKRCWLKTWLVTVIWSGTFAAMVFGPPIRPQPLTRVATVSAVALARMRLQARRAALRSRRLCGARLTVADRTRSGPPCGPGAAGPAGWRAGVPGHMGRRFAPAFTAQRHITGRGAGDRPPRSARFVRIVNSRRIGAGAGRPARLQWRGPEITIVTPGYYQEMNNRVQRPRVAPGNESVGPAGRITVRLNPANSAGLVSRRCWLHSTGKVAGPGRAKSGPPALLRLG